jgi:hypothetical protein
MFFFPLTKGVHASVYYLVCKPFILEKKKKHPTAASSMRRESQPVVSWGDGRGSSRYRRRPRIALYYDYEACRLQAWVRDPAVARAILLLLRQNRFRQNRLWQRGRLRRLASPMAATTVLWPHHLRSRVWRGFLHGRIWCGRLIPKPCESETAHLKIAKFLKVTKFLKIANFLWSDI